MDVAFPADNVTEPLAKILSDRGLKQFHTAETEKYAHVTFFFNGGREAPFPGEDRLLVPSPKVATYDLKPEMSAPELTDEAVRRIESGDVRRHHHELRQRRHGGPHRRAGGGDQGRRGGGRGRRARRRGGAGAGRRGADHRRPRQRRAAASTTDTGKPWTAHTTNPVPFYFVVPQWQDAQLRPGGILADVAPTMLQLLHIPQPEDMTGRTLILDGK